MVQSAGSHNQEKMGVRSRQRASGTENGAEANENKIKLKPLTL
jgi:hypothetical protein